MGAMAREYKSREENYLFAARDLFHDRQFPGTIIVRRFSLHTPLIQRHLPILSLFHARTVKNKQGTVKDSIGDTLYFEFHLLPLLER